MIRRDPEDPKKEIYEQYAAEAKFFVESRLLQRDVKVILEGVSNTNLFLGTVLHPVSRAGVSAAALWDSLFECFHFDFSIFDVVKK